MTVIDVGSTFIELRWDALSPSEQNGVLRQYRVLVMEVETGRNHSLSTTSSYTSVTNLHPFYSYNVTVAAVTVSIGPYSPPISVRTLQDGMYRIITLVSLKLDAY